MAAAVIAAACQRGQACVTAVFIFTVIPSLLGQMVWVFVSTGSVCLYGACVGSKSICVGLCMCACMFEICAPVHTGNACFSGFWC